MLRGGSVMNGVKPGAGSVERICRHAKYCEREPYDPDESGRTALNTRLGRCSAKLGILECQTRC